MDDTTHDHDTWEITLHSQAGNPPAPHFQGAELVDTRRSGRTTTWVFKTPSAAAPAEPSAAPSDPAKTED